MQDDLYYDDVPRRRFLQGEVNALYIDYRLGTGDQTPMDGFDYSMSTTNAGKQLRKGVPLGISTTGLLNPATIRINIAVNQLFKTDPKKGQRSLGLGYRIDIVD